MWRQDDLFNVLGAGGNPLLGHRPGGRRRRGRRAGRGQRRARRVMIVACPLMHGTGQFSALIAMTGGGAVVSLADRQLRRRPSCSRPIERLPGHQRRDRRPGVRRADARAPRRQPRPLRPVERHASIVVVRRDVEPREQAGPAAAHAPGDAVRLVRLVGGGRPGRLGVGGRRGRADRASSRSPRTTPCSPTTAGASSRLRRDGHGRRRRLHPGRLLQGRGQDGGDVPHVIEGRRWSVPGDFADGQRRRHDPPARPRLGVHQHRRREGLPGGGRGGAEDAPERARRRRRRHPRRALRRDDLRRRRARRRAPTSTPPS